MAENEVSTIRASLTLDLSAFRSSVAEARQLTAGLQSEIAQMLSGISGTARAQNASMTAAGAGMIDALAVGMRSRMSSVLAEAAAFAQELSETLQAANLSVPSVSSGGSVRSGVSELSGTVSSGGTVSTGSSGGVTNVQVNVQSRLDPDEVKRKVRQELDGMLQTK